MRDPVAKSYRRIVRGIDLFERRRDLAPGASLRFRLLPRQRTTDMESISLRIVGDTVAVPIDVAADNTFTIPRNARALEEDAIVVPNRKAGSMTWRTDIRTPGLPPDTRRLGDLRLECLVGMESGLISNHPPSILGELARLFEERRRCDQREPRYLFFAERPLWSVTLVHGGRRQVLSVDQLYAGVSRHPMTPQDRQHCDCEVLLERAYFAPLGDTSWPDDALLEFEYIERETARACEGRLPTSCCCRDQRRSLRLRNRAPRVAGRCGRSAGVQRNARRDRACRRFLARKEPGRRTRDARPGDGHPVRQRP